MLKPYFPELKSIWDEVINRSKNGNFIHLRAYMDYHAHRFDEQSVIVIKNDKPVAVFPCNLLDDAIISHSGLTYCGLIYGPNLHAVEVIQIFELLIIYFRNLGASYVRYKAIPHIFHRYPAEEDLYALFRLGARLVRRDLSCAVRLDNRIKFTDSRKSTIRKAQKNDIEIIADGCLKQFYNLLELVLTRFDLIPVHALAELELLKSRFPKLIRVFSAIKNGNLMASALVYDFGHVVHTQYLASSKEGRKFGALDLILANLIDIKFADREYFSFGISTENSGLLLNEGLVFQKEGFGGRAIVHDFYELDIK